MAAHAGEHTPEERKVEQHDHWQRVGSSYHKWVCEGNFAHGVHERFVAALTPVYASAGEIQILDVASASGEPAVTLARALPQARVVSTDFAETYLELGQARAAHAGLSDQVTFQTADGEDLHQFDDASFDVVTCSLGLMFMPRFEKALAEFRRVLKPGGTLAVTVWHSTTHVPFFKTLMEFCHKLDPEAVPLAANTACRFGDTAAELLEALGEEGFRDVAREDVMVEFALPLGIWWTALVEMPLPLGKTLAKLKEEGQAEIYEQTRDRLAQRLTALGVLGSGGLRFKDNRCHFITCRK